METSILAIAISVVIGVATNLLTPYISNLLGKLSNSIKKRNERRKQIFENSVQYLLDNPHEEIVFQIRFVLYVLFDFLILGFALLMMFSNNPAQVVIGFVFSLVAYYQIVRINNRRMISEELIKRKKSARPDIDLG